MDELDVLQRVRAEVEPDPAALLRVRRRVLRHALVRSGAAQHRRRLLVGALAGAVVIVLGLPALLSGGPRVPAAAALVLDQAVHVAQAQQAPGPGEYLHVRDVTSRWYDGREERTVQEWWISSGPESVTYFRDFEGFVYQRQSEDVPSVLRRDTTREELLSWLRRPNGDLRGDDAAYERIGEILTGPTSHAVQARLFDALRHLDGVEIVATEERFGTRRATIIGREGPLETQFAFDARTGRFLGIQGAAVPGSGHDLSYRTITTTKVVDRLPPRATDGPDDDA